MLKNVLFLVELDDKKEMVKTLEWSPTAGAAVYTPLLFNMYNNDLPKRKPVVLCMQMLFIVI